MRMFRLGMAHPMGPLTLADFIGLDVCLDIMRVLEAGIGDPKYRPCPLLVRMVDAGWLGRKSGRGLLPSTRSNAPIVHTESATARVVNVAQAGDVFRGFLSGA